MNDLTFQELDKRLINQRTKILKLKTHYIEGHITALEYMEDLQNLLAGKYQIIADRCLFLVKKFSQPQSDLKTG